jgi:hypothetical protein
LTAEIKLAVQLPWSVDQASQLPHKLTLANDDGSYTQTLSAASDCQAGTAVGTSVMTFADIAEDHTYTLQCDDGNSKYSLFDNIPYDQLIDQLGGKGGAGGDDSPPASNPSIVDPPAADGTDTDGTDTDGTNNQDYGS